MKKLNIGILGATGAVGQEMRKVLQEYEIPVGELRLLASARSAGEKVLFQGREVVIQETTDMVGVDMRDEDFLDLEQGHFHFLQFFEKRTAFATVPRVKQDIAPVLGLHEKYIAGGISKWLVVLKLAAFDAEQVARHPRWRVLDGVKNVLPKRKLHDSLHRKQGKCGKYHKQNAS